MHSFIEVVQASESLDLRLPLVGRLEVFGDPPDVLVVTPDCTPMSVCLLLNRSKAKKLDRGIM
jgi:hypothetical protein